MSEEYIIFAGSVGGLPDFNQAYGYFTHIEDQKTINALSSAEIWTEKDLEMHFREHPVIMDALLNMENLPERYTVFMAEVIDKESLETEIPNILERYPNLQYRFCLNEE